MLRYDLYDLPLLILEQLDPATHEVVARFSITKFLRRDEESWYDPDAPRLVRRECYVSRPDACCGDVFLKDCGDESYTVSEKHLCIRAVDGVFYAEDQHSTNGTFDSGNRQKIEEAIKVESGMILFLGKQPIRFELRSSFSGYQNPGRLHCSVVSRPAPWYKRLFRSLLQAPWLRKMFHTVEDARNCGAETDRKHESIEPLDHIKP